MTPRRKSVLEFIKTFIEREGFSPSLDEIVEFLGVSQRSTAAYHVKNLVSAGLLTRSRSRRGLVIAPK